MASSDALTAAHRFGLGAQLGELEAIAPDPLNWLNTQLIAESSILDGGSLLSSTQAVSLFFDFQKAKRDEKTSQEKLDQPADSQANEGPKLSSSIVGASGKTQIPVRRKYKAFFEKVSEIKSTEALAIKDLNLRTIHTKNGKNPAQATIFGAALPSLGQTTANEYAASDDDIEIFIPEKLPSKLLAEEMHDALFADIAARTSHASLTDASFRERLVRFWSDHFSVDYTKSLITVPTAITMEREAIRPHVTGKFYDMVVAVESHQAMLLYLDNWTSFGPNSWAGLQFGLGLNENLARETLELHTLGVGGGYSQDDIIEYAKAITGWTIGNPSINEDSLGEFVFDPLFHEPGTRTVMGKTYPDTGVDQALGILQDFVRHPSTAKHIARKLAFHFHSDNPPQSLIDQLADAFTFSDGDLLAVSQALINAPEMWDGNFNKLRNSEEFLISTYRALGISGLKPREYFNLFSVLGQIPFTAGSPAGWPDDEASWASSTIIASRLNLSVILGNFVQNSPLPPDYATALLDPALSVNSHDILSGAFTKAQGYALMLMTPEFQRR